LRIPHLRLVSFMQQLAGSGQSVTPEIRLDPIRHFAMIRPPSARAPRTLPMSPSQPCLAEASRERRSRTILLAFLFGLPAAALVLGGIYFGPVPEEVRRYVKHPVECVEVAMFCVALGALGAKGWACRAERRACRTVLLPPWDGRRIPVGEASVLAAGL